MSKVKLYRIKEKREFAFIFVDPSTLTLSCHSSFGNYGYTWKDIGDESFEEFLLNTDRDYLIDKIAEVPRVFDPEQTLEKIKNTLKQIEEELEQFEDVPVHKDQIVHAREEMLDHLSEGQSEAEFTITLMQDCPNLMECLYGDFLMDLFVNNIDRRHIEFWNTLWVKFQEALREEIGKNE